jgi:DNA-binding GntR family transcriptional regulator
MSEAVMNGQIQPKGNATIGLEGPSTIAGRIYERVRDMILRAEISPGEKLLPRQLSEMFGVSSTPIREALRLLEQANLVEIIPHKGAIVRPILSAKQVDDLYTVRLALEQLAIRSVRSTLPDSQWEGLRQAVENYAEANEADDFEGALIWDMRFHSLLAQASDNEILQDIFAKLENQTQVLRRLDRGKTRRQQSLHDHRIILEALKRRDYDSAMAALEEHIMNGKKHVLDILSKLDQS